ncbi:hypothetical protein BKA65DRAFT_529750 [Rhexocercosporidium sp. MPI-PUGE-AT-0058]|nr:hypothetical protein BKA65DRAFT_529750 [Rhexocercosporidium sp. MPI-PUGE-AT-0058]
MESTRIIIDTTLRTKHQAHPGRQEWVSMVECICGDGIAITPFGIFKGKNVLKNWIPLKLLNTTIEARTMPSTPVRQYIQKLTVGTKQLRAQSRVHQYDADNLRSIIKQRTTRIKGKRVVLKGHFHISTQKLYDAIVAAEKATKKQAEKKRKTKAKVKSYEAESEEEVEEEGQDDSKSEIGDCIIVNVDHYYCDWLY